MPTKKTTIVTIRVPAAVKLDLQDHAAAKGKKVGEYGRDLLIADVSRRAKRAAKKSVYTNP